MTPGPARSPARVPTVGGYPLLRQVGEGGMGVVHLAEDRDGEPVAVKVLRPNVVGDEESRLRLAQEVASLRHVRSAHVAEIVDADPWGPVPFVATRFVDGESLQATVEQDGPMQAGELLRTARGLLLAVGDVHAAEVLHRDIKPTNVVMEGSEPILIDFGLARLAEDARLTATGWLMGSPGYLAPEVLLGRPATTATDVHGWAATIVYAATGHSPYGRGHTMAVLDRTRRGEVELDGVPRELAPLLATALAVEPHRRPTVPQALAVLDGLLPVGLTPPAAPPSRSGPRTRPRTVLAAAETAMLAPYSATERLTRWAVLRRFLALVALAAVVVAGFGAAPYLALGGLALGVLLVRGLSRGAAAVRDRRAVRGRRWFDLPAGVLSYPWHVLRGGPGSAALVLTAGGLGALTAAVAVLSGTTADRALVAGGSVLAVATWWGPGSARVREQVGGALTRIARRTPVWLVVVVALAGAGGYAWARARAGVSWAPADGAPWGAVRDLGAALGLPGARR